MIRSLALQSPTQVNSGGVTTTAWAAAATLAVMSVETTGPVELVGEGREQSKATHTFVVRAHPSIAITPKHRLISGSRVWGIERAMDSGEIGVLVRIEAVEIVT